MIIKGIKMNETATERRGAAAAVADELQDFDQATARARAVIPERSDRFHFDVARLQQRAQIAAKGKAVAVSFGVRPATAKICGRSEMVANALSRSGR